MKALTKIFLSIFMVLAIIMVFSSTILRSGRIEESLKKPNQNNVQLSVLSDEVRKDINGKAVKGLKDAALMEKTAVKKYKAFAEIARLEGYSKVALLFRAIAESESVHGLNHEEVLSELGEKLPGSEPVYKTGSTVWNIISSVQGEANEVDNIYPGYIYFAKNWNYDKSAISFEYAMRTEIKHKKLLEDALTMLKLNKENELPDRYFICGTCGNIYNNNDLKRCELSLTPVKDFKMVSDLK